MALLANFCMTSRMVIDDVKAYQIQNPHRLKLADMTEVEKELLRKEMLEKGLLG